MSTPQTDAHSGEFRRQSPPIAVRIKEACRLTGLGRSKLYELIQEGTLEVVKVGSATLVPMENLEKLAGGQRLDIGVVSEAPSEARMQAFLVQAVLTASIAKLPLSLRCDLNSPEERVRVRAEDAIVERMITALRQTD